jgi:hypothetical protein
VIQMVVAEMIIVAQMGAVAAWAALKRDDEEESDNEK